MGLIRADGATYLSLVTNVVVGLLFCFTFPSLSTRTFLALLLTLLRRFLLVLNVCSGSF